MSGTAQGSAGELQRIYRLRTRQIPTNRPLIRRRLPTKIFGTAEARWQAVVEEVRTLHALGRPVVIGTRSIDQSESATRTNAQVVEKPFGKLSGKQIGNTCN